jgi:exopolyphosphatase
VDHNALTGELGKLYGARVVGCIDHHEEEHKVPKDCGEESRIVEKCGSCCSLIVEYCKGGWDSLASKSTDNEATSWNAELARVTLGPIIVDTTNLTSKEKTTPTDVKAVEYLEKWIYTKERNTYNRDVYFKQLSKAKEDLGHLSLTDILRKDYKKWTEAKDVVLGTSAVVKCMSWILQKTADKEEFLAVVKDFAQERNLSICSIMTTSHSDDGVFRRELFVWALNKKAVKAAKKFEAEAREKLGLIQWNDGSLDLDGDEQWRRCWWQERIENSRKQVAPLLRTSIEEAA